MMRKIILAALLLLGMGQAFGQSPPPVPALPDAERRTSYNLSSSTCACSVGFAIYADSTDVDQWIEVWINGTKYLSNDSTHGWAITSATGPLATIPRPITNAVLTFNTAQTGTVQIVGARRPRRTSQFSENRGVAARDLNQVITDMTAALRERWDYDPRTLRTIPGETINPMPTSSSRALAALGFDSNGQPIAINYALGTGTLVGPASSVDGHVVVFDGTSGKLVKDGGPGIGTVLSVGLSLPSIFSVSGSPVTTTGTLTGTLANQSANQVWAGPTSGAAAAPAFRALVGADLPNPSASTLGGVQSKTVVASQWLNSISTSGVPSSSQPAFTDISGTVAAAQLPNPSASTLGGIQSFAAQANKWINQISTSGVPSATQPDFSNLSGFVGASQMPAFTGDVTTTSGSVNTTIANNVVTNAKSAQMAAATFKGNPTASLANAQDFTIQGLTARGTPDAANDKLPIYDNATGTIKFVTPGQIAASAVAGVSSLNGLSGALSIGAGTGISVSAAGATVTVNNTGVTSITPGAGHVSSTASACSQGAITTTGTLSLAQCKNNQTGNYAIQDSDRGKIILATSASAQAFTIAQAGAASNFQEGWWAEIKNNGTSSNSIITITPTTSTIDALSSVKMAPGDRIKIISDGTNYYTTGYRTRAFYFHKNGVAQTSLTHAAYTRLTWSTEKYNTTGAALTSNTWTAPSTGLVRFSYSIWWSLNAQNSTASPIFVGKIIKNSAGTCNGADAFGAIGVPIVGWAGANGEAAVNGTGEDFAIAGDVYELCAYSTSWDSANDVQVDGNQAHTHWSGAYVN